MRELGVMKVFAVNMRMQKFLIFAFMCCFVEAILAESFEDSSTTYTDDTTTFQPETTSYLSETSSSLLDTTITTLDPRQNEVDAKLTTEANQPITVSEIDLKIDNIESERSTERQMLDGNPSTTEQLSRLLLDELNESTTSDNKMSADSSSERHSIVEQTTTSLVESSQVAEDVEEIQEPKNDNEFERFATEAEEESTSTTTITVTAKQSVTEEPTEAKTEAEVFVQQKSYDGELKDEIITDSPELSEKRKALLQIKNLLRAHILKTLLTLLNEVKQRQKMQAPEQQTMESHVVEESLHSASSSDCKCEENDEVSTSDESKVIVFDKNQQRYVYMDKEDYERAQSLQYENVSIHGIFI